MQIKSDWSEQGGGTQFALFAVVTPGLKNTQWTEKGIRAFFLISSAG